MMHPPDFTTIVALDARTIEQWRVSLPTWRLHRPELFQRPWLLIFDRDQLEPDAIRTALLESGPAPDDCRALPWPTQAAEFASQRERMLSAFVHAPRAVRTPYWLKIDTDALAVRHDAWCPAEWFAGQPVWIASPWGYTKPGDQMHQLDIWARTTPELAEYPDLNLPFEPGARRVRHARMASWVSFYETAWSVMAADIAERACGPCRIPVPSQDGYHFYVAQRRGDFYRRVSMRRVGWTNCSRIASLRARAAEILSQYDT